MKTLKLCLATATALAVLGAAASSAWALSCVTPIERPAGPLFDAVALSGPATPYGGLISPARFLVLRYRDGSGPRVVRVATGTRRDPKAPLSPPGVLAGEFDPHAGQVHRIAGTLRGGGKRIRRGQVVRTSICSGTREIGDPRSFRTVEGASATASGEDGARWSAQLLRGPHGLRCLNLHRLDLSRRDPGRACERLSPRRRAVVGVLTRGYEGVEPASTVVAASGRGLMDVTVARDGERRVVPAMGRGRIALLVYDGAVAREELEIEPRFGAASASLAPALGWNGF